MEGIVKAPELGTTFAAVSVPVVGDVLDLDTLESLDTLRLCKDVCLHDLLLSLSLLTSGSVPKNASMKVDSRLIASLAFVKLPGDPVDVFGRRISRFFEPIFDSRRAGLHNPDPPFALLSNSGADATVLSSSMAIVIRESSRGRRRSEGDTIPNSSRS
jgi:hypothetical protein